MRVHGALPICFAVAACGSSSRGGLDRSIYTLDVCAQGRWDALANVTLADPSRYVELDVSSSTLGGPPGRSVESKRGTACTAATDPATCASAITSSTSSTGWRSQTCGGAGCSTALRYFVAEKSGAVTVIATIEALRPLVLPVDSAADAALIAAYATGAIGSIECSGPQVRSLADGSFDVYLAAGDGSCTDRNESRVHVSVDGASTVAETARIAATQSCVSP